MNTPSKPDANMSDQLRSRVHCKLADCCYYEQDSEDPNIVWCKHPDKEMHILAEPCPLYIVDWKKRVKLMEERKREEGG